MHFCLYERDGDIVISWYANIYKLATLERARSLLASILADGTMLS